MKSAFKVAAGALLSASICTPALAGERDPQLGTYLVWNFGAARDLPGDSFQYGMRLDYDSQVAALNRAPPLLVLNFGNNSGADAFLNGSSLRALSLQMNQAGGAGILGGSAALTTAAVIVGVAATAVVVSSTDDNDSSSGGTTGGDTGGSTGGGTGGTTGGTTGGGGTGGTGGGTGGTGGGTGGTGGGTGGTGGGTGGTGGGTGGTGGGTGGTGGVPLGGLLGSSLSDARGTSLSFGLSEPRGVDPEYQQWLDGGTGQMGDLNR